MYGTDAKHRTPLAGIDDIVQRTRITRAALLTLLTATVLLAFPPPPGPALAMGASTGEMIVGLRAGSGSTLSDTQERRYGLRAVRSLRGSNAVVVRRAVGPASTAAAAIARLRRDRSVAYVEPNAAVRALAVPNDPYFARQNYLNDAQYPSMDISAPEAWDMPGGVPVTVGVVDSGIDRTSPDLAPRLWHSPSDPLGRGDQDRDGLVDDIIGADLLDEDPIPEDGAGHGTHVAGIIGAATGNGIGVAGISRSARVMSVKFLDEDGAGDVADGAAGIDWAVHHGARVINASWGSDFPSRTLRRAIEHAAHAGVIVVAAAGNDGSDNDTRPVYPASYDLPNLIAVGSTDRYGRVSGFSNYGRKSVDIAAPGELVYSTLPRSVDARGYGYLTGTSMAAAEVTGAIASFISIHPAASVSEIRAALMDGSDRLNGLDARFASGGKLDLADTLATPLKVADHSVPAPVELNRPRLREGRLHLRWQPSYDPDGIQRYEVRIDGRLVRTTLCDGRAPATSVDVATPRPGRHVWRVSAVDRHDQARDSRSGHFTVRL